MRSWLGVDVGARRKGFDVALLDQRRLLSLGGGFRRADVVALVARERPAVVAIDGPCCCAPAGQSARESERELARAICRIRWTPDQSRVHASPYYAWIVEGLGLFTALEALDAELIEVFPTASWTRWIGGRARRTRAAWTRAGLACLGLEDLPARTNQDQRDAIAAALTARQFTQGQTQRIGEIVVPGGPLPGLQVRRRKGHEGRL